MKNKLLYFALITATKNISCLKIDFKGKLETVQRGI
jgi:hypothetical protein